MSTMVNKAVSAILAALQADPPVCDRIDRVRLRAVPKDVDLAIAVRPVQSEVQQFQLAGLPVGWHTIVSVECYARSGVSTSPDEVVDPLLESVYGRLMADPTLGGVVVSLQPKGVSFDFDADGEHTTCAAMVFNVHHRTGGASLS